MKKLILLIQVAFIISCLTEVISQDAATDSLRFPAPDIIGWYIPNDFNYHRDNGSDSNDVQIFIGTTSNDWVDQYGYGGDDIQYTSGGDGDDVTRQYCGYGNDITTNFSGDGNDISSQYGGDGNDLLNIQGGDGDDVIFLQGDEGNDTLISHCGYGNDRITSIGCDGNDILLVDGGVGNDVVKLYGGNGNDSLDYPVSDGEDSVLINGGGGVPEYNSATITADSIESFTVLDENGDTLYTQGSGGSLIIVLNIQNLVINTGSLTVEDVIHKTISNNTDNQLNNPKDYYLYQNYPNPFNPNTSIKFDIPKASHVKLIIYDMLGREVAVLVNENMNAGKYEVNWDGSGYPSGVYFYKLETEEFSNVKKMVLLK